MSASNVKRHAERLAIVNGDLDRSRGPSDVEKLLETYEEYEESMRDLFTIFASCDKDGNGVLDSIELQSFLRQSKIMDSMDEIERKTFFEKMFKKADHNNTGTIDFQEYVVLHNALLELRERNGLEPIDIKLMAKRMLLAASTGKTPGARRNSLHNDEVLQRGKGSVNSLKVSVDSPNGSPARNGVNSLKDGEGSLRRASGARRNSDPTDLLRAKSSMNSLKGSANSLVLGCPARSSVNSLKGSVNSPMASPARSSVNSLNLIVDSPKGSPARSSVNSLKGGVNSPMPSPSRSCVNSFKDSVNSPMGSPAGSSMNSLKDSPFSPKGSSARSSVDSERARRISLRTSRASLDSAAANLLKTKQSMLAPTIEQERMFGVMGERAFVLRLMELHTAADAENIGTVSVEAIFRVMKEDRWFRDTKKGFEVADQETMGSSRHPLYERWPGGSTTAKFGRAVKMYFSRYGLSDLTLLQFVKCMMPDVHHATQIALLEQARRTLKFRASQNAKKTSSTPSTLEQLQGLSGRAKMTDQELVEMLAIFTASDVNNDRQLDYREFCEAMSSIYEGDSEYLTQLFHCIDIDGSGSISVWEFVTFWRMGETCREEMKTRFNSHLMGISLNVHSMFTQCSLNVPLMFTDKRMGVRDVLANGRDVPRRDEDALQLAPHGHGGRGGDHRTGASN
eukprot:CAMPEP_0198228826 /NCGR_PEP_ID=MMETSP1445-20131203/113804_1 /TAXON_ID=36898 /ORGANISM="Pyramimonas sp., Strain CCMP2087" /LENGTH=678 /DNA_ID=CAMNT_0043909257 /DNA_START=289 /DNA_END=2328 /DNA_ORIENTATION=+